MSLGSELIKEVPELGSRWKTCLVIAFAILVISAWIVFFWWLGLIRYGPLIGQFLVAFIASSLECMAVMEAPLFKAKFGG